MPEELKREYRRVAGSLDCCADGDCEMCAYAHQPMCACRDELMKDARDVIYRLVHELHRPRTEAESNGIRV